MRQQRMLALRPKADSPNVCNGGKADLKGHRHSDTESTSVTGSCSRFPLQDRGPTLSDIFISYARSTAAQAQQVAEALRAHGYSVWIDDDLPAHRTYSRVIEEQMTAAKAAVVIWSADAVQSEWVLSEANRAREDRKLVQVTTDKARLPMPFDTIQCADLRDWSGDLKAPGWRKVVASLSELMGAQAVSSPPGADAPLTLPSKPSIAVMPLANLSGDPEQEYFADGLVEEITGALSRIRSIFVISSGSMLSFKGKGMAPMDVARQLGVRYILEGSVRKSGVRVRIAVSLLDAVDGSQIWAERFEDTLEDVFQLQDKVALAVAGRIEPSVRDAEIRRGELRAVGNMGSYDLYLRARASWRKFNRAGLHETLDLLHRALANEPEYAAALGFAAWCHGWLAMAGWSDDPRSDLRQARQLAHRALEVARDDPEILAFVADALVMSGGDMAASHRLVERAVAMNPGLAFGWHMSGIYTMLEGDWDAGLQCIETSMRLDPVAEYRGPQLCWVGIDAFRRGRFEDAVALLGQAVQLLPGYVWAHAALVSCLGHLGRASEARTAAARFSAISSLSLPSIVGLFRDTAFRQLFSNGIALAEGKTPTEAK